MNKYFIKYLLKKFISKKQRSKLLALKKFLIYKFRKYLLIYAVNTNKKDINIILGAALTHQKNWFSSNEQWLDISNTSHWRKIFKSKQIINNAVAEHVFEHLTRRETIKALKLIYGALKHNGNLRIAVPDGNNPNHEYIKNVGIKGIGADAQDHKQLLKYEEIKELMENAGFKVTLKEGYKSNGELIINFIDPIKGFILRSRSNHKINKLKQSKVAGWNYPDSISSLIIDGEKV